MNNASQLPPTLQKALQHLTTRYQRMKNYNSSQNSSDNKPSLEAELEKARTNAADKTRFEIWHDFQKRAQEMYRQYLDRIHAFNQDTRNTLLDSALNTSEIDLCNELLMLYFDGLNTQNMSWKDMEKLRGMNVSESATISEIARANTPKSMWVEWEAPPIGTFQPRWMKKVRALLLSYLEIFDMDAEFQRQFLPSANTVQTNGDQTGLLRTLIRASQEGQPSKAYFVFTIAVQNNSILCYPRMLAHLQESPFSEAVQCAIDSIKQDSRRTKDIEEFGVTLAAKILSKTAIADSA